LAKRFYDVVGIATTVLVVNYTTSPFILSTAKNSIQSWRVLGFYGHVIVIGGLTFFYVGGTQYLRGLQKQMGILPPSKGPAKAANGTVEKDFVSPVVPTPKK
jgi:lysophospholipid acyltransferase